MATPSRRRQMIKNFISLQNKEKKEYGKNNEEIKPSKEGLKRIQELWLERKRIKKS